MDLPGRGRRGAVHRVRLPQAARTSRRPAGRAPHSRTSTRRPTRTRRRCSTCGASTRSSPPATSGHRHRGQDPPRTRDHRAGPRRPEELARWRTCPPASSAPTAPGWSARSWRSTSPAPPARSPVAGSPKATTATIRRTLITVPARIASSARRLTMHLPATWPWQHALDDLFTHACGPPHPLPPLTTRRTGPTGTTGQPDNTRSGGQSCPHPGPARTYRKQTPNRIGGSRLSGEYELVRVDVERPGDPDALVVARGELAVTDDQNVHARKDRGG